MGRERRQDEVGEIPGKEEIGCERKEEQNRVDGRILQRREEQGTKAGTDVISRVKQNGAYLLCWPVVGEPRGRKLPREPEER
jgi:hypothetical protein